MNPLFTAGRIAYCLNRAPKSIRRALRDVPASGVVIVNGKPAAAWELSALPLQLRDTLAAAARQQSYGNAVAMLAAPPKRWEPPCPLNDIADSEIARASKLRLALMPSLLNQHNAGQSAAEFEAQGIEAYAKEFGHAITARHWRSLFKRTLQRDAGAEDCGRIELYLPDKPARKNLSHCRAQDTDAEFPQLADYISACAAPPSETEQRGIWTGAFDEYARLINRGAPAKRAARQVRDFLFARASFLASSRAALFKAFDRKLERYRNRGPEGLQDGRANNGAGFDFSDEDRDRLIHRAVFQYRGEVAPAWLDLLVDGFSEEVRQHYRGKSLDKSHVPASVMESIAPEVEILTVMNRGPRAFDAIKGHVTRSYDGIASLQCISGDDFTLNSYFYVLDGKDWFTLTRGQTILFIDFRSSRILGWALEPRASYSSLTIRSLCTHVFGEFGVPEVLYFERGLWKSAIILKGKKDPLGFTEISQGLCEFGIQFIHAIRPRSKTIERIGGMFQDLAEAEPGYCGRDERRDAPESLRKQMAEVQTHKAHPSKYFYSLDQWNQRIGEIVARYNATPQQGRILAGLSPDQGFEQFIDRKNPPIQFDAGLRYLLAHEKRQERVTLNGVTIQIGKRKFNYRGREISHLVGRDVLAWLSPDDLDVLVVTDLDRQNPICIPRSEEPNALESIVTPGAGILGRELARIEGQASYMKTRFNVLKAKFPLPERQALANAQTRDLGRQIELGKSDIRQAAVRQERRRTIGNNLARRTGIVPPERAGDDIDQSGAKFLANYLAGKKENES